MRLAPLRTPARDATDPMSPSVRLLVARARDHGVELGPDHAHVPVRHLPAARRDAAGHRARRGPLRSIGPIELLEQLRSRPGSLARRGHRGQASHRSVAEVVGWSYRLLEPDEQVVFETLSVFAGPFTSDLARTVVDEEEERWDGLLDGLVSASLIVVDRTADTTRYRLLHPVRAVAAVLLGRSGRTAEVRSRLIDEIIVRTLDIGRGRTRAAGGPPTSTACWTCTTTAAASIRWLVDNDDEPDRALLLVATLWGIVHNAHSSEIHALGEAVLDRWPDPALPRWPNAAATVATCRFLTGDTAGAIALAEAALPHAMHSRSAPPLLLRVMAQSRRAQGDLVGARDGFAEAAEVALDRQAFGLAMEMRVDEGLAMVELGDDAAGLARIESVIDEAAERQALINRSGPRPRGPRSSSAATPAIRRPGPRWPARCSEPETSATRPGSASPCGCGPRRSWPTTNRSRPPAPCSNCSTSWCGGAASTSCATCSTWRPRSCVAGATRAGSIWWRRPGRCRSRRS